MSETVRGAEQRSSRSDRRVVTVLFADLSGFTSLGEDLDPEELSALLRDALGELMEEIRARDGWLEKQIGDALLAIFGAPVVHEDDPARAVSAALAMQGRMRALNDRIERRIGRPLSAHIGVNTGLVVMGPGIARSEEDARRKSFIVVGDTVNTAARLQQAAGPGQVVVGESTYASTHWAFEYRKLPPVAAKGKGEKLVAYECLGAMSEPLTATSARGIGSPLLAREPELEALRERVTSVLEGHGGIAIVTGEAGLGKSRLVTEVRHGFEERPLRWLEGRALSLSQTISYWPFLELIRTLVGITEEDGEEESWAKLEAGLAAIAGDEVAELLPYLATLLALPVRGGYEERLQYLDAEAMGRQILRAARRLVERLAGDRPLALVFEDWHWSDESSAQLLEHLLPLIATVPLLIICNSRPERDNAAARLAEITRRDHPDRYTEVRLTPLSATVSAQLVQNLLELDDLPRDVRSAVVARAEGNPFFVEEIVRALIDLEVVVRRPEGGWRVAGQIDEMIIPDTLRGVIVARIDRLEEELGDILRVASVIGRSFVYRLLREMAEANGKLDEQLAALQELELIRERRRVPELEYIFKHALTQEAIYESILLQRRRELHRRIGEFTEGLFADRLEEFYGLLAYHYARAEEWEKAEEFLFKAGDQAGRVAADAEALRHYEEALAAHVRVHGDRWDPLQRAQLERKIGEALVRRGDHEAALEHLHRTLDFLGRPYPGSRWGVRAAIGGELVRQIAHRLAPRLLVRGATERVDEAVQEECLVYYALGWIDYSTDQERQVLDMLRQLNRAERSGLAPAAVRGSAGLGIALDFIPRPSLARGYHRRAVELAERIKHPLAIGVAFMGRSIHDYSRGDWATVLECCSRATEAFREAGDVRGWGTATQISTMPLRHRGELDRILATSEELRRVGQEAGDAAVLGWGLKALGVERLLRGDLDAAAGHFREAIRLFEAVPDLVSITHTMGDLGLCLLRQGKLQEATTTAEESRRLIDEGKLRGFFTMHPRAVLAECYVRLAEDADEGARSEALARAGPACRTACKHGRAFPEGEPPACRAEGTYQWLRGKRRAARKAWERSLAAAAKLDARYELALTHLEIGRRLGEREHLEQAAAIFAAIGAQPDLDATRKLLDGSPAG